MNTTHTLSSHSANQRQEEFIENQWRSIWPEDSVVEYVIMLVNQSCLCPCHQLFECDQLCVISMNFQILEKLKLWPFMRCHSKVQHCQVTPGIVVSHKQLYVLIYYKTQPALVEIMAWQKVMSCLHKCWVYHVSHLIPSNIRENVLDINKQIIFLHQTFKYVYHIFKIFHLGWIQYCKESTTSQRPMSISALLPLIRPALLVPRCWGFPQEAFCVILLLNTWYPWVRFPYYSPKVALRVVTQ